MSDAIINKRYNSSSGGSSGGYVLMTKLYNHSSTFVVPEVVNQKFSVRIFGGGGGCSVSSNLALAWYGFGGGLGGNGICIIQYYYYS